MAIDHCLASTRRPVSVHCSCRAVVALFISTAFALPFTLQAAQLNERIAVTSSTAPDYKREHADTRVGQAESYVFAQGQFFESGTRDRGLEATSFSALTKILAPDLAKQAYYPTTDVSSADLLIMIHWGATQIFEDGQRDAAIEAIGPALEEMKKGNTVQDIKRAFPNGEALSRISDTLQWTQQNANATLERNAALIGYRRALDKLGGTTLYTSEEEKVLRIELGEERYFVVLMAYDNHALRDQKVKRLRWVTRLSVRTPGNRFSDAITVMSQAGGHVYGRDLEDLIHIKANLREGLISLGDVKILESNDSSSSLPGH